jgi:GAF domain-containing protein
VGAWLVVWGLLLLLVSNHVLLGWVHVWPMILVASGLVTLRVFHNRLTYTAVFAASWAILLGACFLAFSSGTIAWGRLNVLWPVIPFIIGTSFLVAAAAVPGRAANGGTVVGSLVIFASVASYLYETGTISERVAAPFLRFWPLVFVLAGFVLMRRDAAARVSHARTAAAPAARVNPFEAGALSTDIENEILRRVRAARTPHGAAMTLVRELRRRFPRYTWVGIYRLRGDILTLDETEYMGLPPEHRRIPLSEGICGAAARERETQVVPDVDTDPRYLAGRPAVKSEIVVPIFVEGEVVGVLDIDSDETDTFTDDDRRFLELLLARVGRLIHPARVGTT